MAIVSVMGPAGAPMKSPYGSFAGKPPFAPPVSAAQFTVSGGWVSLTFAEFFPDVVLTDAPVTKRTN
jgi:hypothetical protein